MIAWKPVIGILTILVVSAIVAFAGSQGSVAISTIPLFAICASVGFILHWAVFIPSYLLQTEHYFDLTGALSYISTITLAAYLHPLLDLRGLIICVLISIWAVRLGSFLFMRIKRAGQDRRFIESKTRFWQFLYIWTMGGAWVFITMAAGLAAITSMTQRPLGIFAIAGVFLWLVGFSIEVVADRQKTKFRQLPENADHFITSGLWAYSRHPNYFGEILLWLGITVIALPTLVGWQYVTLISPIFVALLLIKVSGVRLLEADGKDRWGSDPNYQYYVNNTPVLVPFIGKR
ncbi:MAG: DUF1295 domain-containing protein [Pseudomonadota bacterium]|nr:DUF1295 domain-containing protein [Pseudomonadota bacterium]MED5386520.1 DUF1295 domain-containing protein [Pseudomonadota bacterium]